MPNINLQEKDMSTFADQQFISIAYNGKTNEVSGNAKVLAYRVTFVSDNKDYCIVEVGENQKVNIPTPPTKEGYTFKQWLLNGEAFDFSTVITSDILLIAEFEEAPAPSEHIFEGEIIFDSNNGGGATQITLDTSKTYNVKIGNIVDKDVSYLQDIEGNNVYADESGEFILMVYGEAFEGFWFAISAPQSTIPIPDGTYMVTIDEAPEPLGVYEWDGVWDSSKETDIEVTGMQLHKFADVIPDAQLIGATVEHSGGTQTITAEIIEESRMGGMLVFGNIMLIGTNVEYGINGSYFVAPETPSAIKLTLGGVFITELNPPTE